MRQQVGGANPGKLFAQSRRMLIKRRQTCAFAPALAGYAHSARRFQSGNACTDFAAQHALRRGN
jgi:hypothetical protein